MTRPSLPLALALGILTACATPKPAAPPVARLPAQASAPGPYDDYVSCVYHAGYLGLRSRRALGKCDGLKPAMVVQAKLSQDNKADLASAYFQCITEASVRVWPLVAALNACVHLRPAYFDAPDSPSL